MGIRRRSTVLGASVVASFWMACGPKASPPVIAIVPAASSVVAAPTTAAPEAEKPPAVSGDFEEVVRGCSDMFLSVVAFGGEPLLVGVAATTDGHVEGAVLDTATERTRAVRAKSTTLGVEYAIDDVRVVGSWDALQMTIHGACAPNLEAKGNPVTCTELHFAIESNTTTMNESRVGTAPTAAVPPPEWAREAAALRARSPGCTVVSWKPLSPSFVFVRAADSASCPFGAGGALQRKGGTLVNVAIVAEESDANVVAVHADGTWWVGDGVDLRVGRLRRIVGDRLVEVDIPGVATDLFALGERLWMLTGERTLLRWSDGVWTTAPACSGRADELRRLDEERATFSCSDGSLVAYDATASAPPLTFHPPKDDQVEAAFVRGFWLIDRRAGSIWGPRKGRDAPWKCERGPLRFERVRR